MLTMNIHVTTPRIQPDVYQMRKDLENAIDAERDRLLDEGDPYDIYQGEAALDKIDPRVAEAGVREWKAISRAIVGGVAGAFAGYSGGNVALYGLGGASATSIARNIQQNGEGLLSGAGAGLIFGGGIGFLSSIGGGFGAIVGGLTGAAIAANLPGLLKSDS